MLEKVELPPQYKTGHEHIDEQHAQLLAILMALMTVMKNEKKHSLQKIDDEFKELIDELHHYTKNHFLYEERIMEKTQFPEMEAHKTIHHAFMKKISDIQHEADKKRDDKHKLLADMIVFIKGWYMEHVLIEDKKIVAHQKEIEAKAKPKA